MHIVLIYIILNLWYYLFTLMILQGVPFCSHFVMPSDFQQISECILWIEAWLMFNLCSQTSSGKGLPSHFWTRDNVRSILPGLWRKRTGLLLSGPKSSFQIKVNFAFHLEIKVPESGGRVERHRMHVAWSPVWSSHSQWWFGLPCHLLVLVHCVFWSPQSTQLSTRKF